jgi:negative regulator of sigma E activity
MEFSKKQIDEAMSQYLQDNEAYGDYNEGELISEVFKGVKSLLTENISDRVSLKILQEHANGLNGVPKDILEDFVLYLNMNELDNLLT